MKVAFFVGAFPGLSETFILDQITGLLDRGHEVDAYGWPSEDVQSHDDVTEYGLMERTYTAPALPDSYAKRAAKGMGVLSRLLVDTPEVIRTLNVLRYGRLAASLRLLYASTPHVLKQKKEYDIAHCHFGQNGILALALRELDFLRAKRVLTTFHGHDVYVDVPRYSARLRRFLFEKGDGFTVNSEYTAQSDLSLAARMKKYGLFRSDWMLSHFRTGLVREKTEVRFECSRLAVWLRRKEFSTRFVLSRGLLPTSRSNTGSWAEGHDEMS